MARYFATVSSKGQVTIPADVRRTLGVGPADQVTFVVTEDRNVELRRVRYTLEDVLGSLEPLPNASLDFEREIEEATEEEVARKMRRWKLG